MPIFKIRLLKKEKIAFKTIAFYFTKPDKLKFQAGQYGKFTLINPSQTDIKGDTRSLSFASAPFEKELMISIRLRNSAFKKELNSLPLESDVELLAPLMMFKLPKNKVKPLVFLSGGIGVTTARSMILEAINQQIPNQILLFNSNRKQKDIPFFEEIAELDRQNDNFTYIPNLTKKDPDWNGESGHINIKMLQKYLKNPQQAFYFLIGSSSFMWGMYKILQQLGVKENNINFDEFTGY